MKNIQGRPNNMDPKSVRIQSKQRHEHVRNHARLDLAYIHFDYERINMIL